MRSRWSWRHSYGTHYDVALVADHHVPLPRGALLPQGRLGTRVPRANTIPRTAV